MGSCYGKKYRARDPTKKLSSFNSNFSSSEKEKTIIINNEDEPIFKEIQEMALYDDIKNSFKFIKNLGSGHFGNVRLAYDRKHPTKEYAIKTIQKKKVINDLYLLKRELQVLRSVDHPNIIKFFQFYEDKKYFHLVLELCQGGELYQRIYQKQKFSEKETAHILRQIISAIYHLHKIGIVHRDIKPENFLLSSPDPDDYTIKLIDFGLSKKLDPMDGSYLSSIAGTPFYVAPEVLKGHYTFECDIWSVGIIMYLLLEGNPPFVGKTNAAIFDKIKKGSYSLSNPVWKTVSPPCKDLIKRLLCKKAKERITAKEALEHKWFDILGPQVSSETKMNSKIYERLRSYAFTSRFKKEAIFILVKFINDEEIQDLKNIFHLIDVDHTGMISTSELAAAISQVGVKLSQEEIDSLLVRIDLRGNQKINYSEFLAATLDQKKYLTKDKLWSTFKFFDVDNTNYITLENIRSAFETTGRYFSNDDMKGWAIELKLKDRGMSFQHFCQIMRGGLSTTTLFSDGSLGAQEFMKNKTIIPNSTLLNRSSGDSTRILTKQNSH